MLDDANGQTMHLFSSFWSARFSRTDRLTHRGKSAMVIMMMATMRVIEYMRKTLIMTMTYAINADDDNDDDDDDGAMKIMIAILMKMTTMIRGNICNQCWRRS